MTPNPSLDPIPSLLYHPAWNALTGSPLATLLLGQILYWWNTKGRQPFYKYAASCPAAAPGDSWLEELGFSRRQFETARDRIATKITRGDSKQQALENSLVIYWTDAGRRTWYQLNEPLLLRRLAELQADGCAPPPTPAAQEQPAPPPAVPIPPCPAAAPADLHRAARTAHCTTIRNRSPVATAQNDHQPVPNAQTVQYLTTAHDPHPMLMPVSANAYTETNTQINQTNGGGGVSVSIDHDLVAALAGQGDSNPRALLARYPAAQIRAWLDYCTSPAGAGLTNKPGFIRSRLSQGLTPPPSPSPKPTRPSASRSLHPTVVGDLSSAVDPPPSAVVDPSLVEIQSVWSAVLDELRLQMDGATFHRWLAGTRPLERVGDTLYVAAPNPYARDWLEHRLRRAIDRTLAYVAPGLSVEFRLPPPDDEATQPPLAPAQRTPVPVAPAVRELAESVGAPVQAGAAIHGASPAGRGPPGSVAGSAQVTLASLASAGDIRRKDKRSNLEAACSRLPFRVYSSLAHRAGLGKCPHASFAHPYPFTTRTCTSLC